MLECRYAEGDYARLAPLAAALVRLPVEIIEAALLKAAEADTPMVTEAAQHIIAAGGKRFRPLMRIASEPQTPCAQDRRNVSVPSRYHFT